MVTTLPNPNAAGRNARPYCVEQIDAEAGPTWRLCGPGLRDAKAYPYNEFRDKLAELAQVMNFAWHQCRLESTRVGHGDSVVTARLADDRARSAAGAEPRAGDPTVRNCSHTRLET